jgi:hypothetical protein
VRVARTTKAVPLASEDAEKSVRIRAAQGGFVIDLHKDGEHYEHKTAVAHSMTGAMKCAKEHLCGGKKKK